MTLDKHNLQGIAKITSKTLPVDDFEQLLINAGYTKVGSAPEDKEIELKFGGVMRLSLGLNLFIVLICK
jgi:hypothetical protein